MNERIRELIMQAQKTAAEETIKNSFAYEYTVYEKFAELIVRKCLDMADEFELDVNRSGLVDKIKQHFGIES